MAGRDIMTREKEFFETRDAQVISTIETVSSL
jgi:hypothetical protein